jgi:isopentenyl diphosphate isomerase/L-lactate dehydrogenase-like FMN-dependent dehydrogenase
MSEDGERQAELTEQAVREQGLDFASFQYEMYAGGLLEQTPALPVSAAELQQRAREKLDAAAYGYVAGGAGSERTMQANLDAFERRRIVPRMLRDVSARDLSTTVLGTSCPAPLGLAPVGAQAVVHPDGEQASARAAAAVGLPMTVSTVSTMPMEEIAASAPGPKWFQLYWPNDRDLAASFLGRAEAAGYRAIVVTLDTFLPGWKPRDLQRAWQPFLQGVGIANYVADPVFRARLAQPPEDDMQAAVGEFVGVFTNPRLTWEDLEFLRSRTTLPIALKGILHPEDARAAREHGIDAVVVSNHGGRQVDGAIASLDALPAIVDAVGDDLDVLLDGGVRCGADVVKALALGADAVLLGRPYIWGLAVGGEAGVLAVLRALLAEVDLTVGLSGHTGPGQLHPGMLVREGARV